MSRLIDADALWMDIIHAMDYCDDILEIIEQQPTVEPNDKLKKITDLIDGTIDHFNLDDAMDLLYQIKDVCGKEKV